MCQNTSTKQEKAWVKGDGDIAEAIQASDDGDAIEVEDIDEALAVDGVPCDDAGEEEKFVLRTGFKFKDAEILLETDNPERLEEFQGAWHRLERQVFGDYS